MTATKRVRWTCPNGTHPGILGSSRPPKDSLVRYCLPCSEATGRLVERVAPTLARQREAAAARNAEKAKRQRAAERRRREAEAERTTARYTVDGVDLRDEMRRLVRLRAFGGPSGRLARRLPRFTVSHHSRTPRRLAFAEPWNWRLHLAIHPGITLREAQSTLVHELAHLHVGEAPDGPRWHGDEFYNVYNAALTQAYGDAVHTRFSVRHGRSIAAFHHTPSVTLEPTS